MVEKDAIETYSTLNEEKSIVTEIFICKYMASILKIMCISIN